MKILIIGEYSGFSNNLCKGFKQLGHEACAFNWGDNFKNIPSEDGSVSINVKNYKLFGYEIKRTHYIRRLFSLMKLKRIIRMKKNKYDCALIINPEFIKTNKLSLNPYPTKKEVKSMLLNKDMIFLSACGNDYIFNSYLQHREKTSDYIRNKFNANLNITKAQFLNIIDSIKGIIPVMVDYADAYRKFQLDYNYRIFKTIPLPFESKIHKCNSKNSQPIKIFHGVSRIQEKGSDIILDALRKTKETYGDLISINIVRNVPLNQYLLLMEKSDIIIDQCYGYSYGMNTIEALSMGKVVLSGNEPTNAPEFGVEYCPVINIRPSVENIVEELSILINNPDKIEQLAQQSQYYFSKVHDHIKVAKKYIKLFEEEIQNR